MSTGKLFVVGTPIGNLDDITLRALRVLSTVDVIAAEDTRAAQHLLTHHQVRSGQPSAKIVSFFAGNEAARTDELVGCLLAGQSVAVISEAGMPGVSDPGQRLVAAAHENHVAVEVIPGPSAALHALIASGLPSERFLFLGFPPRTEGQRLTADDLLTNRDTQRQTRVAASIQPHAPSLTREGRQRGRSFRVAQRFHVGNVG